jgi:hypothetical protein
MVTSKPTSTVTINGIERGCTEAEARFSFLRSPATATLVVPSSTFSLDHDEPVVWTLDGDRRFTGLVRDFDRDLEGITTVYANSVETRLTEYQNSDDPAFWGGLTIKDLTGSNTATGGQLINAILAKAGVSVGGGSIADNGVVFNTFGIEDPFILSAGTDPQGLGDMQGPGETLLDYINKICRVMAVFSGGIAPVGFYRFFSTTGGDLYSFLIGGRPRSAADFTFTEGVDFLRGKATRRYPAANAVLVTGFNYGDGGPDGNGGPEYFRLVNENPFMPPTRPYTYTFNSPLIERSKESDPGGGMSCEMIANAIMPDVDRQTVYLPATMFTSALLGPGQTIKVQGNLGGGPGYMGVGAGDPLWLQDLTVRFNGEGVSQDAIFIGGGTSDPSLAPPPV